MDAHLTEHLLCGFGAFSAHLPVFLAGAQVCLVQIRVDDDTKPDLSVSAVAPIYIARCGVVSNRTKPGFSDATSAMAYGHFAQLRSHWAAHRWRLVTASPVLGQRIRLSDGGGGTVISLAPFSAPSSSTWPTLSTQRSGADPRVIGHWQSTASGSGTRRTWTLAVAQSAWSESTNIFST